MERRFAAILAADVVGYFRLMGEEEAGTLARLEGLKAGILDPLIAQHHGRVVKLMGDGFLVEFASVVDALTCALDWRGAVAARAGQVPEERAMRFRIGGNLGDVMVKVDDAEDQVEAKRQEREKSALWTDERRNETVRYYMAPAIFPRLNLNA